MTMLPCWKTRDTVYWLKGFVAAESVKVFYVDSLNASSWAVYGELWDRTSVRLSDGWPFAEDAEAAMASLVRVVADPDGVAISSAVK